jgi:hypothetical protein
MKKLTLMMLCLMINSAWALTPLKSQFKKETLQEFTSLSLQIMPDAGTQLIFPFLLDNPELNPPLKVKLTNSNGFEVPVEKSEFDDLIVGQNTITILGKGIANEKPVYLGNLFISVGGYNVSISLQTTYKAKNNISNIVFNISNQDRNHLVEQSVKRRTKQLEDNYKEKVKALDQRASDKSLKHVSVMALEDIDETSFKMEEDLDIGDKRLVVYIDKLFSYGDKYQVLLFELENHSSSDFNISSISLSSVDEDIKETISGFIKCPELIKSDTTHRCSFATTDKLIKTSDELKISINTDRGEGVFQW